LVDVDYASTLLGVPVSQLNGFVEYINKMRNLNLQATQTDINNTKSLISNRNQEVVQQKNENTYKSSDTSIANYINSQLGKNVIGYDSTTKQYGLANELENGESYLNSQQIYSWYKDPIIQKALLGVNDGTLSSNEATTFLLNLGYSADDIRRVKNYTFGQEGE